MPVDGFSIRTNLENHIKSSSYGCQGTHEVLSQNIKECKVCMARKRVVREGQKRKALEELSVNPIQLQNGSKERRIRPPRTRCGCTACQIHLCKESTCWEEHTQATVINR